MKKPNNKKTYVIQDSYVDPNYNSMAIEKKKIPCAPEIADFYTCHCWNENAQWKRDHYHQDTKKEKEMSPEERYAFDYASFPKNVSLDNVVDSHGEGNLPYVEDFSDEVIDLMIKEQRLAILKEALKSLTDEERQIYKHYYVNGGSGYGYEDVYGTDRKTIDYRKKKFLKRLEKYINKKM